MRSQDPHLRSFAEPHDRIVFSSLQDSSPHHGQQDVIEYFGDECIALADGVGGMPHGDVAAKLAAETAVWGYRHIRQRPFYWEDKKRFMHRIFRTANIAVWQKHREHGFEEGLATTLLVAMFGPKACWVGTAGDTAAFLYHEGHIQRLTHENRDEFGALTRALGIERFGLVPEYAHVRFAPQDALICATDGVADWVRNEDLVTAVQAIGNTEEELRGGCQKLLDLARLEGSRDDQTVAIVKRVAVS
jgi:protein phosphatase